MILGDPALAVQQALQERRLTIDEIFRHVAARRAGALALIDAPNRDTFTDGPPRRLTYEKVDRVISAIAGRLRRMGLPTDTALLLPARRRRVRSAASCHRAWRLRRYRLLLSLQ